MNRVVYIAHKEGDELTHYGVKGMKWGVRKKYDDRRNTPLDNFTVSTKKGTVVSVSERRESRISSFLKSFQKNPKSNYGEYDFKVNGKRVGYSLTESRPNGEFYLNWISIKSSERGKGYATAALNALTKAATNKGFSKITLEVPEISPDARHVYEKHGFKVSGESKKDDLWGSLTSMEYSIQHSETGLDFEELLLSLFKKLPKDIEAFLEGEDHRKNNSISHYGVKGMRWGVLKKSGPTKPPLKRHVRKFGTKSATRIRKTMDKGVSEKASISRELRRRRATAALKVVGAQALSFALADVLYNKGQVLNMFASAGKKIFNNVAKNVLDSSILDVNGELITRYRGAGKVVDSIVGRIGG